MKRPLIQKNLSDISFIHSEIINSQTGKPYSQEGENWSIPLYYVWRILRYDLGEDRKYPYLAQSLLYCHPQEYETKIVLQEIENKYYPKLVTKWRDLI